MFRKTQKFFGADYFAASVPREGAVIYGFFSTDQIWTRMAITISRVARNLYIIYIKNQHEEEEMRKTLKIFYLSLFLLLTALPACPQPEQDAPAAPIVESLLALMRSDDPQIGLGAMLLSGDVHDSWRLEPYVRDSLSDKDEPWVRAVKAYVLSRYTLSDEDAAAFLDAMLLDLENFNKLIDFESSVMRSPGSGILGFLMDLARRRNAPDMAEKAGSVIRKIYPLTDGWVADFLHVD
jgi:hypothetical protein